MRFVEKAAFVASVAVLALLYGFVARSVGWFPTHLIERALEQAHAIFPSTEPDYLAPKVYDRTGARIADSAMIQPGFTLISSVWKDSADGSWKPGLRLISSDGRTHHQWLLDAARLFPDSARRRVVPLHDVDIDGSYLFPNGDVLINVDYTGTARLDACGRVLWRVLEGDHHSIARADDGSFWIPGVSRLAPSKSAEHPKGFPGLRDSVFHDWILHVSEDGKVLSKTDVLDLIYDNHLERYIARSSNEDETYHLHGRADVTHLNDIEPLSVASAAYYPLFRPGDLLISLRYLSLVFVVDPGSGKVKWHSSDPFIHQHDADFMGDGWIGVFDNNQDGTSQGEMLGGSRIVAVQPQTDSMRALFPTSRSDPLYTRLRGRWQLLDNGNLLITEALAGRVVEVAPDGHTVWDWVVKPYDARTIPTVSEGTRYELTPKDVASWPCSTGPDGS